MPRGRRPRRGSRPPMSGSLRPSAGPRACRLRPGASIPHSRFQRLPSPARGSTTAGRTRAGCLLAHRRSARAPQNLKRLPQGHMCPEQRAVAMRCKRACARDRVHAGRNLPPLTAESCAHRHHDEQHSAPRPSAAVPCPLWLSNKFVAFLGFLKLGFLLESHELELHHRRGEVSLSDPRCSAARHPPCWCRTPSHQRTRPGFQRKEARRTRRRCGKKDPVPWQFVHKHHACSRLAGAGAGHSVAFITFCRTVGAFTRMPFSVPGLLETEASSARDKPPHVHRQSRPA